MNMHCACIVYMARLFGYLCMRADDVATYEGRVGGELLGVTSQAYGLGVLILANTTLSNEVLLSRASTIYVFFPDELRSIKCVCLGPQRLLLWHLLPTFSGLREVLKHRPALPSMYSFTARCTPKHPSLHLCCIYNALINLLQVYVWRAEVQDVRTSPAPMGKRRYSTKYLSGLAPRREAPGKSP
jgi:hypothetical protein